MTENFVEINELSLSEHKTAFYDDNSANSPLVSGVSCFNEFGLL